MSIDAACTPCCCVPASSNCSFPDEFATVTVRGYDRIAKRIDGNELDYYELSFELTVLLQRSLNGSRMVSTSISGEFLITSRTYEFYVGEAGSSCQPDTHPPICPACKSTRLLTESTTQCTVMETEYVGGVLDCYVCPSTSVSRLHLIANLDGTATTQETRYLPDGSSNTKTASSPFRVGIEAFGTDAAASGVDAFLDPWVDIYYGNPDLGYVDLWGANYCGGYDDGYVSVTPTQCFTNPCIPFVCTDFATNVNYSAEWCPITTCIIENNCVTYDCFGGGIEHSQCGCGDLAYYYNQNTYGMGSIVWTRTNGTSITYTATNP